jgi:hypothetical protein
MNRLRVSLGALVAIALSVLAMEQLANPRAAWAVCYCDNTPYTTPIRMAKGADCDIAESNLVAKLQPDINCNGQDVCAQFLIITIPCFWDSASSAYKVHGRISYRCNAGICP